MGAQQQKQNHSRRPFYTSIYIDFFFFPCRLTRKENEPTPSATQPPKFFVWLKIRLVGNDTIFPPFCRKTEYPNPKAFGNKPAHTVFISWYLYSLCGKAWLIKISITKKASLFFHLQIQKQEELHQTKTFSKQEHHFLNYVWTKISFSAKKKGFQRKTNCTDRPLHKEMFLFPLGWELQNKGHEKILHCHYLSFLVNNIRYMIGAKLFGGRTSQMKSVFPGNCITIWINLIWKIKLN